MARAKRSFKRQGKPRLNKTKKLVTGHGPTMLERLAAQSSNIGMLAKSIVPIVAAINTEQKYFDVSTQATYFNPGTGDQIINLTGGIAQGLTDITRIGDSILARNIALKIDLFALMSTTVHQSHSRLTLICWKENAGINAPTAAKIFSQPAVFLSAFNKDYTDQFVVLKDKVFNHNANISAATNQDVKTLKIFKKLEFHMRFLDATANGPSVNHIYLVLRNSSPTSANQGSIDVFSRLNYTDN